MAQVNQGDRTEVKLVNNKYMIKAGGSFDRLNNKSNICTINIYLLLFTLCNYEENNTY